MKRSLCTLAVLLCMVALVLLPACSGPAQSGGEDGDQLELVDMAGRSVVLQAPGADIKVGSTSPVAAYLIYTVNPDKLLGWNYALNDLERSHILPAYHDLTVYGMGEGLNSEAIIAAAPHFNLYISDKLDEAAVADADQLQQSMDIPVLVVSGKLKDTAEAYRLLGRAMGEEQKAEELAAYAERILSSVDAVDIPAEERVRIYYGNGPLSLETAPQGSTSSQVIDMVDGDNVAKLELGSGNRIEISLEQVLSWDPEVIVVNGEPKQGLSGNSAAEQLLADPGWADVSAIQNGRVYGSPKAPFSWIDRPTGPNRLIGLVWLAEILYPEAYGFDLDQEVNSFYQLFYHETLTDEQRNGLYLD
ncbi:MAG: ABC transporter substrate-binding protein [Clostridiales bacterium]|nr:ABC transporter substrate-binding protein [Clostridiales bacterium]